MAEIATYKLISMAGILLLSTITATKLITMISDTAEVHKNTHGDLLKG